MVNDQPNIIKKSLPVNIVTLSTNFDPLSLPSFSGVFLSLATVKYCDAHGYLKQAEEALTSLK